MSIYEADIWLPSHLGLLICSTKKKQVYQVDRVERHLRYVFVQVLSCVTNIYFRHKYLPSPQ